MEYGILLCITGVIFFIILFLCLYLKKENFKTEDQVNGVCVFDIDGTITHGLDNAAEAITKCKELKYKIAINTARPTKWYHDLDLNKLGLVKNDFDSEENSDFYHGEPFNCSFPSVECMENSIADTKIKHLNTIHSKWKVDKKKIILFDDQYPNVRKTKEAGFSVVFANNVFGGLPDNVIEQIEYINGV